MRNPADDSEFDVVVSDRRFVAEGVVALTLQHPVGAELPAWAPGAHIELILTAEFTRQYSLCGTPEDRGRWRIGVLREPNGRGGSAHVHDNLTVGTTVRVRGPRNHFRLEPARRYRFIAGGIGITPLLPMVAAAEAARADWTLTYGGRTQRSMGFVDELTAYGGRVTLRPQDKFGLLDLGGLLGRPTTDTLVYCCGPGTLLDAVERHCSAWQPGLLRVERFTPKDQYEPLHSHAFDVELASTGINLAVPADHSILEVLEDAGVQVLSSCRGGTCGTCETPVLAGDIDHRDSLLSDEEKAAGDTMLICVSRAAGAKLVLDV
jgi:ferredoxin-NADP reductase